MSHTPGLWKVRTGEVGFAIDAGAWEVCSLSGDDWPVAQANARLIAAAPELLEALKALDAHMDFGEPMERISSTYYGMRFSSPDGIESAMAKARAAIAKAEGRDNPPRAGTPVRHETKESPE